MPTKLANEIIEASNGGGDAVKKCNESHYLAEINKSSIPIEEDDELDNNDTPLFDDEKLF
jgi:hypothetical protein